ncbi:Ferredoxin subunit of nitrite reductase or a ring-hydroxylating dioxygenase [Litoreibacter ascidiaceicola]|uniref:Ferredoxin subunit of nitrite reductase or a ring-hydroxylating dioxygenase n=1 Tax=Litoreibacter ascidiaceicola TaxID=1486859 RepID=A0A1M5D2T1_9RHOB|nr:Rieske 2Fe-2S domain-containing protein [Litoreibacter ascidiaceicola]SHF61363.1 Ferredoxin subunit of nitrite reductase or a ring-hydroxylating dioxygenase [Litoreibacter ascidiaceicola]
MAWTDFSSAPDYGTPVCPVADVSGAMTLTVTTAKGEFPILLVKVGSDVKGYVNACPHQYLPLDYRGSQLLSSDGAKLMCTAHGASFMAETGDVIEGAECGLDAVPLEIRDGMIVVGGCCATE